MAAKAVPGISWTYQRETKNNATVRLSRQPTIREVLSQIENQDYKSFDQLVSLLIVVWTCLAGKVAYFHDVQNIFKFVYRETAKAVLSGSWSKTSQVYKRGLARALTRCSDVLGKRIDCSTNLCTSLVMTIYDSWGDPAISQIIRNEIDEQVVLNFVESEPTELMLVRVECLVSAGLEDSAIRLCRFCLQSEGLSRVTVQNEEDSSHEWKLPFVEWLAQLLFKKGMLQDLVADCGNLACHEGVVLIRRIQSNEKPNSKALSETLINLFLVRDLLFNTTYCCTKDLMRLWCECQVQKQSTVEEVQVGARKLIVGHASSSAYFYVFVDALWEQYGITLLPLYLELFVRGLTSDLNYLEAARQADAKDVIIEIENHMASVYYKLSTLFTEVNKDVAIECMLSSFSLNPTKDKLDVIKKLSLQISMERAKLAAASSSSSKRHRPVLPNCIVTKKNPVTTCDRGIQVGESPCHSFIRTPAVPEESPKLDSTSNEQVPSRAEKVVATSQCESNDPREKKIYEIVSAVVNHCINTVVAESLSIPIFTSESSKCLLVNTQQRDIVVESENCPASFNHCSITSNSCHHSSDDTQRIDLPSSELSSAVSETLANMIDIIAQSYPNSFMNDTSESNATSLDILCDGESIKNNLKDSKIMLENNTILNHNKSILEDLAKCNGPIIENPENHKPSDNDTVAFSEHCEVVKDENSTLGSGPPEPEEKHSECVIEEKHSEISIRNCDNSQPHVGEVSGCSKEPQLEVCSNSVTDDRAQAMDTKSRIGACKCTDNSQLFNTSVVLKTNSSLGRHKNMVQERGKHFEKHESVRCLFKHRILEANIPGVSSSLLADLIVVLESLRNPQLQIMNSWSDIKNTCENYMETVCSLRSTFMNRQLNGSVDSEEDSVSEVTPLGNRVFASFQSNDSIYNDPNVDKSTVLHRFMNTDEDVKFGTYVNLSDIHHPYLHLDRLLRVCASSTRHEHVKHHRRHRDKGRDPKKAVLKQLLHGSGYNHEPTKRKKKKKRKGRKEKSRNKKHHSTHNKGSRELAINKKKRQRNKKKKSSPVEFPGGDYCSDFSSTELMRIVNEHSNSFSQLDAQAAKRAMPSGSESASCSNMPSKKKRKQVSFKKLKDKKNSLVKAHDKHKHSKSKRDKKKSENMNSVQDYSHIVEFSSVKQMQSVRIRQSSVAVDLSKVPEITKDGQNILKESSHGISQAPSDPSSLNACSDEELRKIQMLLVNKQPSPASGNRDQFEENMVFSSNKQTVLKYVSSKTTSHLLSIAQASNRIVMQNSDANSSVKPLLNSETVLPETSKYVVAKRSLLPAANSASGQRMSTLPRATSITASVAAAKQPVITTLTFPVNQGASNTSGAKFLSGKLVIPLSNCNSVVQSPPSSVKPIVSSVVMSGNSPVYSAPNVILVKKSGEAIQMPMRNQQLPNMLPVASSKLPIATALASRKSSLHVNKSLPNTARKVVKKYIQPLKKPPVMATMTSSSHKSIVPSILKSRAAPTSPSVPEMSVAQPVQKTYLSVAKNTTSSASDASDKAVDSDMSEKKEMLVASSSPPAVGNQGEEEKSMLPSSDAVQSDNKADEKKSSESADLASSDLLSDSIKKPEEKEVENKVESPLPSAAVAKIINAAKNSVPDEGKDSDDDDDDYDEEDDDEDMDEEDDDVSEKSLAAASCSHLVSVPVSKTCSLEPTAVEINETVKVSSLSHMASTAASVSGADTSSAAHKTQLQPLTINVITTGVRPQGLGSKSDAVSQSEVPTRSLTSISEAVRFSLMDMDDATGSVENQVLQAFHSFPQETVAFTAHETVSTTETTITTLTSSANVITSQTSQTYQTAVCTPQRETFSECQMTSTASSTPDWNTSDPVALVSSILAAKSLENDSGGEMKDEDRLKKKRKKKEKSEKDPESVQRFWCELCNRGFFSAYNLRRHCRNVHKMDLPKGSSDVPFSASNSQCLTMVGDRVICSAVSDTATQSVGAQIGGTSKTPEFVMQSPSSDPKVKEFSHQTSPQSHTKQIQQQVAQALNQSPNFAMHSPPISPITPPKDFRHQSAPSASVSQTQQGNFLTVGAALPKPVPKFQMIQSSHTAAAQNHQLPRLGSVHQPQVSVPSPMVQQPRLIQQSGVMPKPTDIQTTNIVQPLPCQVQQIQQNVQCPLSQSKKQDQRSVMLQPSQHESQDQSLRIARHPAEVQKAMQQQQQQQQQFKKAAQLPKSDSLPQVPIQMSQTGTISHIQPPVLNPQMQKLVQIRQAALCRSPEFTLQLPVQGATADTHTSPVKSPIQYFQTQVTSPQHPSVLHSAVRQTLASCATARQNQSNANYITQPIQNVANAEFLSRLVPHSTQDRPSCSQPFTGLSGTDLCLVSNQPHTPIIRQSTETTEGLDDLEQFLLENMVWGGGEIATQVQQSLSRSGVDSVALPIAVKQPLGMLPQAKNSALVRSKSNITKPKACKPTITSAAKNFTASKSCLSKKKSCTKKGPELGCAESLKSGFSSVPGATSLEKKSCSKSTESQCEKSTSCCMISSAAKETPASCSVEENDSASSDSVQCIEITRSTTTTMKGTGANFNALPQVETTKTPGFYKVPTFCGSAVRGVDHISTSAQSTSFGISNSGPVLNVSSAVQPIMPQVVGSGMASRLSLPEASTSVGLKQPLYHCSNNNSATGNYSNLKCQDGMPGCGPKPSLTKSPVATSKPSSNLGCMGKEPVDSVIPIFECNSMQNDNLDAEKELRNLQSKISDCEKHLKNSVSSKEANEKSEKDTTSKSSLEESVPRLNELAKSSEGESSSEMSKSSKNLPFLGIANASEQPKDAARLKTAGESKAQYQQNIRSPEKSSPEKPGKAHKGIHFLDEQNDGAPAVEGSFPVSKDGTVQPKICHKEGINSGCSSTGNCAPFPEQTREYSVNHLAVSSLNCVTRPNAAVSESRVNHLSTDGNTQSYAAVTSVSQNSSVYRDPTNEAEVITTLATSTSFNSVPLYNNDTVSPTLYKSNPPQSKRVEKINNSIDKNFQKPETLKAGLPNERGSQDIITKNATSDIAGNNLHSVPSKPRNELPENNRSLSSAVVSTVEGLSPVKSNEADVNTVSTGRTRLRDTPKTSVKRSCPCCTDTCPPKKCRANNSSSGNVPLFLAKIQKANSSPRPNGPQKPKNMIAFKSKTPVNAAAQVKTRSSHRLRSRNGSVT